MTTQSTLVSPIDRWDDTQVMQVSDSLGIRAGGSTYQEVVANARAALKAYEQANPGQLPTPTPGGLGEPVPPNIPGQAPQGGLAFANGVWMLGDKPLSKADPEVAGLLQGYDGTRLNAQGEPEFHHTGSNSWHTLDEIGTNTAEPPPPQGQSLLDKIRGKRPEVATTSQHTKDVLAGKTDANPPQDVGPKIVYDKNGQRWQVIPGKPPTYGVDANGNQVMTDPGTQDRFTPYNPPKTPPKVSDKPETYTDPTTGAEYFRSGPDSPWQRQPETKQNPPAQSFGSYDEAKRFLDTTPGTQDWQPKYDPGTQRFILAPRDKAAAPPASEFALLSPYIMKAIEDGNWDVPRQILDFLHQPTQMERFKAAMDIASSPADYFTVMAMARGQLPIQAQPGTFQRIAPESQAFSLFGFGTGINDQGKRLNAQQPTNQPYPKGPDYLGGGTPESPNPPFSLPGGVSSRQPYPVGPSYIGGETPESTSGAGGGFNLREPSAPEVGEGGTFRREPLSLAAGPGSTETQLGPGAAFSPTGGVTLTRTPDQQAGAALTARPDTGAFRLNTGDKGVGGTLDSSLAPSRFGGGFLSPGRVGGVAGNLLGTAQTQEPLDYDPNNPVNAIRGGVNVATGRQYRQSGDFALPRESGGNILQTEPGLFALNQVGLQGNALPQVRNQFPAMGSLKFPSMQAWNNMLPAEREMFQRAIESQGIRWKDYAQQWQNTMPGGPAGPERQPAFSYAPTRI